MYLSITLAGVEPATDLGYLLYKHPDKLQSFEVSAGTAYVFYPEATAQRCTASLLLDLDPVALATGGGRGSSRGRRQPRGQDAGSLGQYVNDRPYAASSMLAVAMGKVFRTAMSGRCDQRPQLASAALPLSIELPALPCTGGPEIARRVFEPLGWEVRASPIPHDPEFPGWGDSRYLDLRLSGRMPLSVALAQLYVLLPVLDDAKHYWVSVDEVDKLIRAGEGWLAEHPEYELITRRYLRHSHRLTSDAFERLVEADDTDPDTLPSAVEAPRTGHSLADLRRQTVNDALRAAGASRVLDLGAGDGKLTAELIADPRVEQVTAIDVSPVALRRAERRVENGRVSDRQAEKLSIFQSSLSYRDRRLRGHDAAVLMEVIEHIDPPRLPTMARNVFGDAAPGTVIVTTPNVEFNVRYESLGPGEHRHGDHRFEWTRAQFREWARSVADSYGYQVEFDDIGEVDPVLGSPSQLAVFTRTEQRQQGAA